MESFKKLTNLILSYKVYFIIIVITIIALLFMLTNNNTIKPISNIIGDRDESEQEPEEPTPEIVLLNIPDVSNYYTLLTSTGIDIGKFEINFVNDLKLMNFDYAGEYLDITFSYYYDSLWLSTISILITSPIFSNPEIIWNIRKNDI